MVGTQLSFFVLFCPTCGKVLAPSARCDLHTTDPVTGSFTQAEAARAAHAAQEHMRAGIRAARGK